MLHEIVSCFPVAQLSRKQSHFTGLNSCSFLYNSIGDLNVIHSRALTDSSLIPTNALYVNIMKR